MVDKKKDKGNFFQKLMSLRQKGEAHIQVEPTVRCNLSCVMCDRKLFTRTYPDLTYEHFLEFKKRLNITLSYIDFVGYGEPLLCPDLFRIVTHCRKENINVGMVTNGLLLEPGLVSRIFEEGVNILLISLDAFSREKYEQQRRGGDWERLQKNISFLVNEREKRNSSIIFGLATILIEGNCKHIEQVFSFIKEIGLDGVEFLPLLGRANPSGDKFYSENSTVLNRPLDLTADIPSIRRMGQDYGIKYVYFLIRCPAERGNLFVDTDGNLYPCCQITQPLGNLFTHDYGSIKDRPKFREFFRTILEKNEKHPLCGDCIYRIGERRGPEEGII